MITVVNTSNDCLKCCVVLALVLLPVIVQFVALVGKVCENLVLSLGLLLGMLLQRMTLLVLHYNSPL